MAGFEGASALSFFDPVRAVGIRRMALMEIFRGFS